MVLLMAFILWGRFRAIVAIPPCFVNSIVVYDTAYLLKFILTCGLILDLVEARVKGGGNAAQNNKITSWGKTNVRAANITIMKVATIAPKSLEHRQNIDSAEKSPAENLRYVEPVKDCLDNAASYGPGESTNKGTVLWPGQGVNLC